MTRPRTSPITTIALGLLAAATIGHTLQNRDQAAQLERLQRDTRYLEHLLEAVVREAIPQLAGPQARQ